MTLTGSMATLADYWVAQFNADLSGPNTLGLKAVFYGDQARVPFNPTLCVEPANKTNNLRQAAAARVLDPVINITVIVYHFDINTDQENNRSALLLSEAVETFIHTRPTAGANVIHCYVTDLEAGYIERGGALMRASRLNIEHKTRSILT